MASVLYPYSLATAPADRARYAYSPFVGEAFLDAWREDRSIALAKLCGSSNPPAVKEPSSDPGLTGGRSDDILEYIWGALCVDRGYSGSVAKLLEKLLQRFEVSLRLHEQFNENFRPVDRGAFANIATHLRLGEVFSEIYRRERDLRYLSALSKLIDGLIPASNQYLDSESSRLANLIESEIKFVNELMAFDLPTSRLQIERQHSQSVRIVDDVVERRLDGVVILAARTARSQAYVQAIARAKMLPDRVIVYGTRQSGLYGQCDMSQRSPNGPSEIEDIHLPDLGETIEQTAIQAGWKISAIAEDDVNSPSLIEFLRDSNPKLTVFSGYGGQIVGNEMLAISPFIHAHAGRLPEYRGSTTIYYSWLKENTCSVTTFLLSDQLDKGRILRRKDFPPPPSGLDVDYEYDSAIRANCLVETLAEYSRSGELNPIEVEFEAETRGCLFFIIHPILRHVARIRK